MVRYYAINRVDRSQGTRFMSLYAEFITNRQRVIHKWKHYFPVYERHFGPWVNKTVTLLEIGCGVGGSLQMWKRFLGPHATIVGIDIQPRCRDYEEDQIHIRIGSQQDTVFLQSVLDEFGPPDIVLDDGSHVMSQIAASFAFLYPTLSKNGVYLVEDLHTAYWEDYEGGLRREGSFIERAKTLIDELNADHTRGQLPPTDFTRTTLSMHFYDSIVVFERGLHTLKIAPKFGEAPVVPKSPPRGLFRFRRLKRDS
jgi:SAM-dependent methyltransferase